MTSRDSSLKSVPSLALIIFFHCNHWLKIIKSCSGVNPTSSEEYILTSVGFGGFTVHWLLRFIVIRLGLALGSGYVHTKLNYRVYVNHVVEGAVGYPLRVHVQVVFILCMSMSTACSGCMFGFLRLISGMKTSKNRQLTSKESVDNKLTAGQRELAEQSGGTDLWGGRLFAEKVCAPPHRNQGGGGCWVPGYEIARKTPHFLCLISPTISNTRSSDDDR